VEVKSHTVHRLDVSLQSKNVIKLYTDHYKEEEVNITDVGKSCGLTLSRCNAVSTNKEVAPKMMIGVFISMKDYPQPKTKLVKIVPRFTVVNNLSIPLLVREEGSNNWQWIPAFPNDLKEISPFVNLSLQSDLSKLMVRANLTDEK